MGYSISDTHKENVKLLKEQGEHVKEPLSGDSHSSIRGYNKKLIDGKIYFGAIVNNDDGTKSLFLEMGIGEVGPLKTDEIGLCDSKLAYDYMHNPKKIEKYLLADGREEAKTHRLAIRMTSLRNELALAKETAMTMRKRIENIEEDIEGLEELIAEKSAISPI